MHVTLSGPSEMEVVTGANGEFELVALPPGSYSVDVTVPPNRRELSFLQYKVSLEGAYACGEILFWPRISSRVEGRVLDRTGAPIVGVDANGAGVAGATLWVVAVDDRRQWTRRFVTNPDGAFSVPAYRGRRQQLIVGDRKAPRAEVTIVAGDEPVVTAIGPQPHEGPH